MIQITADEATYMREHGFSKAVRKTYTKHPTYYLVESHVAMRALRMYQNTRKVGDTTWKN